jgi:glucokinase
MSLVLALDVGGTKTAAGIVRGDGEVLSYVREPTPQGTDAEAVWATVTDVLDRVIDEEGDAYTAVGIGCGGPMLWPQGIVSPGNMPAWRDFPLLERVRERYAGDRPVAIHNDAVALAVAEHRWGAGRGRGQVLGMVVSTGVGAGLVLGGRRIDGKTGNAGHIGHTIVDPDGEVCRCGARGCLEPIARGPAIAAYAVEHGWTGEQSGVAVAEGARQGDPACVAAFDRAGRAVGRAIASAAALLDLDVAVVGGGISQAGDVFWTPLRASFHEHAGYPFVTSCRITEPVLGPTAGVAGAGALVLPEIA